MVKFSRGNINALLLLTIRIESHSKVTTFDALYSPHNYPFFFYHIERLNNEFHRKLNRTQYRLYLSAFFAVEYIYEVQFLDFTEELITIRNSPNTPNNILPFPL